MLHVWCVLVTLVLVLRNINAQKRIVIAIDSKTDHNSLLTPNELFEYRLLSHATKVILNVSLVTHSNWTALKSIYDFRGGELPNYLSGNDRATALFDDKVNWKAWMGSVGLGSYIPRTYYLQDRNNIKFPLILKVLSRRNGRGVTPILNKAQFTRHVGKIIAREQSYMLEEGLTGMGLSEVFAHGAVYQGGLVSMRCTKRTYPAGLWHSDAATPAELSTTPFVGSYTIKPEEEHFIPCSEELVNVTRTMFAAAPPYTGAFCSTLKTDMQGQVKMIEVNARLCGLVVDAKVLQAVVLVPLSFAVLQNLPREQVSRASWPFDPLFVNINKKEKEALKSGGGMYLYKHIVVDKFNHSLRVDTPAFRSSSLRPKCNMDIKGEGDEKSWWQWWPWW